MKTGVRRGSSDERPDPTMDGDEHGAVRWTFVVRMTHIGVMR
jgi:hypothetical protein